MLFNNHTWKMACTCKKCLGHIKRPLTDRRQTNSSAAFLNLSTRLRRPSRLRWLLSSVTTQRRWLWRPGAQRLWWPWWRPWLRLSVKPPTLQPISSSAFNAAILSPPVINISSLFTALRGNYATDAVKKWGLDMEPLDCFLICEF